MQKASCLKTLCELVVKRFGGEPEFCAAVTRAELLSIKGIGPETADRALLFSCSQLAWPVDGFCLRVFSHYRLVQWPESGSDRKQTVEEIKRVVASRMPAQLDTWQRLHALMQLEGSALPKPRDPRR